MSLNHREKIACAAIPVLIPPTMMFVTTRCSAIPLEVVTALREDHPNLDIRASYCYITTHGRTLDSTAAFRVAAEAGQLLSDDAKPPLHPHHLWRTANGK